MGIDIYARWDNQTAKERAAQQTGFAVFGGRFGHLRENYPAWPSVTRFLVREAFCEVSDGDMVASGAVISAETLHDRLPKALSLMKEKLAKYYEHPMPKELEPYFNDIIAFVALCERMEKKTGKPVNILAVV
jgi:hypothetical protein